MHIFIVYTHTVVLCMYAKYIRPVRYNRSALIWSPPEHHQFGKERNLVRFTLYYYFFFYLLYVWYLPLSFSRSPSIRICILFIFFIIPILTFSACWCLCVFARVNMFVCVNSFLVRLKHLIILLRRSLFEQKRKGSII